MSTFECEREGTLSNSDFSVKVVGILMDGEQSFEQNLMNLNF